MGDEVFKDNSNNIFINKQIYSLHYPEGKLNYSIGLIKGMKDIYTLGRLCVSFFGSSGGPLIKFNYF